MMRDVVKTSATNALSGLYLSPDMAFYSSDLIPTHFAKTVEKMHSTQVTTHSYAKFADTVTETYAICKNPFVERAIVGAALTDSQFLIVRWFRTAAQTAINIHLNTIRADDTCEFPRIVPHTLQDMRITRLTQINRDLLWRILVSEPWQTCSERMRAQYARLADVLGQQGFIEELPEIITELAQGIKPDKPYRYLLERRSIKRAYRLHERLFGVENLRTLFTKKTLRLEGHRYNYQLSVDNGDLFRYTTKTDAGVTPIHMILLRKDDVRLCSLCFYFEDTPILDHLIAIQLHLRTAATEMDMLSVAQVQITFRAFYDDPMLPDLKGLHDPSVAPLTLIDNLALHANNDELHCEMRHRMDELPWQELAIELMGYPAEFLAILKDAAWFTEWDFLDYPDAVSVLDRAKNFFR